MKVSVLAAAGFATVASANPIAWSQISPRSDLANRANLDAQLASRSISGDAATFASQSYDYVVVGAGTAGLAVAARLSENGKYTVGVLEAGGSGFGVGIIDTPGQFGADLNTIYDWNYTTVARPDVPSSGWPRGKVLGGSSALNFEVWDRSSSIEIDAWEQLGNPGWNWNNLYRAMKKSEKFTAPSASDAAKLGYTPVASDYGSAGPVQVSFPKYISQQVQRWIGALNELGIPTNSQPNAGDNVGASNHPSDINPKNSTRSYSAPAYLFPNQARQNLKVLTNALATKVNFSKTYSGLKATSVSIKSGGRVYSIRANKEVILSAGTVNTPQLLELSGIGGKQLLSSLGIQTLVDLPAVGENMQDHTYSATVYKLKPGFVTLDSLRNNATFAQEQTALYQAGGASILTETVPSIGYVSLERVVGADRAAKMIDEAAAYVAQSNAPYKATLQKQIEFLKNHPDTVGQMELIGIDGYFAGTGAPAADSTYFTILAAQQHLLSRGSIHITKNDPTAYPAINSGYFTAPFDLELATAGTAYTRKIGLSNKYSDMVDSQAWPTADRDLTEYTRTTSITEYHPIGTASMLPRNQGGVVDPNLKVYGTTNLRVIDASIMPLHIAAHIQATIYGIAEYGAQLVQQSW
ncbi:related to Glucose oxidase [Pseudozyma flocculosa]|uniref:Related to Glucose oxidase n=1 Tax=Pseudozyma flocculosa TaxID=84751 RepID=A0A5C3F3K0_9BASI|nr:related to Glucose oxidase [Pseudozyma flocculosa]